MEMAMPSVTGTVREIFVWGVEDLAWAQIEDTTGTTTKVIIWSAAIEDYSPTRRLTHGNWIALLREALTSGKSVTADYSGALMDGLYLKA
jgi:hypothetical protein